MTDQELIKQAREGNNQAFEQIVKKYESQVAATVIGMLGKCYAADDVGQEVFIRFHKSINRFREDASLGTYLTRIAINLSLNELQRRNRRLSFFSKSEENGITEPCNNPDDEVALNERQELVQNAIQKLESKFRSVIVLRLIRGYSTEEAAEILNIPLGTVLSRLSRAHKKLKKQLTPFIQEEI